jgi:hypothetical protein
MDFDAKVQEDPSLVDLKQNALGLTTLCFESHWKPQGTNHLCPMKAISVPNKVLSKWHRFHFSRNKSIKLHHAVGILYSKLLRNLVTFSGKKEDRKRHPVQPYKLIGHKL